MLLSEFPDVKTAYVHIIGFIGADDEVSAEKVRKDLEAQKPFDRIEVFINSGGGDPFEAFAVNAVLRSYKKPVKTLAMSTCASAATLILAAGDEGDRESLPVVKLIFHNPWGDTRGDADTHEKRAEYLRKVESLMADFYVEQYGVEREFIVELMKQDKPITPEEALRMGLVDKISEEYAVAARVDYASPERIETIISQINQSEMNHKKEKAEGVLDKIKALVGGWNTKAEVTDTVTEKPEATEQKIKAAIEDALTDGTPITIEAVAMVNGEPAPDGDHALASGITISVSAGEVTAIVVSPQASEDTAAAEDTRLKELEDKVEKVEAMAREFKVRAEKAEGTLHQINNTVFGSKEAVEKEQYEPASVKASEKVNPFAKQEAILQERLKAKKQRAY